MELGVNSYLPLPKTSFPLKVEKKAIPYFRGKMVLIQL